MKHLHTGKVRDLYRTDDGLLLLVASDRISAYDHVLPTTIPDKGAILTALSLWWFAQFADLVPNHVVSTDVPAEFAGRALLCRELSMVPVECVARSYLTGSGLESYQDSGSVCGVALPGGLVDGSKLPEPIFTPTTKAPFGDHDAPMRYEQVVEEVGADAAAQLRDLTIEILARADRVTAGRGVLIADTKVEFGRAEDGHLVLADELLTPDSSRFWAAEHWEPGHPQASFDKQYVRDWLTSPESGWDRHSGDAPPPLPEQVIDGTRARYVEAYERLTGDRWR